MSRSRASQCVCMYVLLLNSKTEQTINSFIKAFVFQKALLGQLCAPLVFADGFLCNFSGFMETKMKVNIFCVVQINLSDAQSANSENVYFL